LVFENHFRHQCIRENRYAWLHWGPLR
jgi:hypothetical protein